MLISIPTGKDLETILKKIETQVDKTESRLYSSKPFKFFQKKIDEGQRIRRELADFEFVGKRDKEYLRSENLDEILKNSTLYLCTAVICTPLHLVFLGVPVTTLVVGLEYVKHLKKYKEEGNGFMIINQLNPLNMAATYFFSGIGYLGASLISVPVGEFIVNYKEAKKIYTYSFKSAGVQDITERKAIAEKIYSDDKTNSASLRKLQDGLPQASLPRLTGY